MFYQVPEENLQARPRPAIPAPALLTVRQFAEKHPALSAGSIRQLIFASHPRKTSRGRIPGNGFAVAIVRLGRKIMINETKFFEWLDSQQKPGKAAKEWRP